MNKCKLVLAALLALSVAGLTACASADHQESTGQYVDSSAVTVKVKAALLKDKKIKSLPITVNTYKNTVQLSGFVNTEAQKARAGSVASHVEGVQQVDNAIVVKSH
ncbi:MAG: BON domain-containing protein [Pseudomonadota bacterium]